MIVEYFAARKSRNRIDGLARDHRAASMLGSAAILQLTMDA